MTKQEKDNVNELAEALIADALQCENETELYHSLERMVKGMLALKNYCEIKEATQ